MEIIWNCWELILFGCSVCLLQECYPIRREYDGGVACLCLLWGEREKRTKLSHRFGKFSSGEWIYSLLLCIPTLWCHTQHREVPMRKTVAPKRENSFFLRDRQARLNKNHQSLIIRQKQTVHELVTSEKCWSKEITFDPRGRSTHTYVTILQLSTTTIES